MKREEFLRLSALLGISLPLQSALIGCKKDEDNPEGENPCTSFQGNVLIIGAGPAGMSAGYLLAQQGIDFQILEATSTFGGRTKTNDTFAEFPIPLGAEWIHSEETIFEEIVNDSSIDVDVNMVPYDPSIDYALSGGEQVSLGSIGLNLEQKFVGSSWRDFYAEFVLPSIEDKISYNTAVQSIDYSGDEVIVETAEGQYSATRVIVTVPVKLLQEDAIAFTPAMPSSKQQAIDNVKVWDGFKMFLKFTDKFYPAFTIIDVQPFWKGETLYYDAGYGQESGENILGLVGIGKGTLPYVELSEQERTDYVLAELDEIFEGQASLNYVDHIYKHWNNEPYARAAYVHYYEGAQRMQKLAQPLENKVFFAGDGYTGNLDYSSVHAAARSAKNTVEFITA
ncbi:MAG: NAD(P)/FAD-dependent oxidoreductase [Bacteroidota bacterium]